MRAEIWNADLCNKKGYDSTHLTMLLLGGVADMCIKHFLRVDLGYKGLGLERADIGSEDTN